MSDELIPVWGYDGKTGEPQLFHLKPDEKLPKGWLDSPAKAKAK